jgi:hypothetical protein
MGQQLSLSDQLDQHLQNANYLLEMKEVEQQAFSYLANEVLKVLDSERLRDDLVNEGDVAYNQAVKDCIESVTALFDRMSIKT